MAVSVTSPILTHTQDFGTGHRIFVMSIVVAHGSASSLHKTLIRCAQFLKFYPFHAA
jgi:hypothetical protein